MRAVRLLISLIQLLYNNIAAFFIWTFTVRLIWCSEAFDTLEFGFLFHKLLVVAFLLWVTFFSTKFIMSTLQAIWIDCYKGGDNLLLVVVGWLIGTFLFVCVGLSLGYAYLGTYAIVWQPALIVTVGVLVWSIPPFVLHVLEYDLLWQTARSRFSTILALKANKA